MEKFIDIITDFGKKTKKTVMAIGVFDGVHRGHQAVIKAAVEAAAEIGAVPGALTFVPHPRAVLGSGNAPELLISPDERISYLREAGAENIGIINFSREIAAWEAETFLEKIITVSEFELAGICVGSTWKFGRKGSGSCELLEKFCAANGLVFRAVGELCCDGVEISSTSIRQFIADGALDKAAAMLGRRCRISGKVGCGMRIAGSKLRAPTANIEVRYGVLPPDGVFSGRCCVGGRSFTAVLNIGAAPTFGYEKRRVEVHLIGFDGDLYGSEITVELTGRIRDIRKFSSAEELQKQIACDISAAVANSGDAG